MNELMKYFPKQIAFPERVTCKDKTEFFALQNKVNKIKGKVYYSLYNCDNTGSFSNPMIDKIALDLDSANSFNNMVKSHKILMKHNIMHFMKFSTGGFWLYLFTKNYEHLQHKQDCLLNSIDYVLKLLNLTMGDEKICDTDHHCKDIARVSRLPNSYDLFRKRFCIPINADDLEKGLDYIKKKSKRPCFKFIYYGTERVDISKFDNKRQFSEEFIDIPDYKYKIKFDDKTLDGLFKPCIKRILLEPEMDTYDNRYLFALYCHEICLTKEECNAIAKEYFGKTKRTDNLRTNYDHFRKFKVLQYAYNRGKTFPHCETMFQKGICKGKTKDCEGGLYRE